MNYVSFEKILSQIEDIAICAGTEILKIYETDDFAIKEKSDDIGSPLTEADKAANDVIIAKLSEVSKYPVVSEENEVEADSSALFWLIDPLDGTKEFIKRNGEFTVNIALIENGKPVLGVVYAPVLDVVYAGFGNQSYKKVHDKKEMIKSVYKGNIPTIVTSRSHKDHRTIKLLEAIGEHKDISMGSSLKICLVAEGKAMLYPRMAPTYPWDTAAADAVVRAAGGRVTDTQGNELDYGVNRGTKNPSFIVATKNTLDWQKILSDLR